MSSRIVSPKPLALDQRNEDLVNQFEKLPPELILEIINKLDLRERANIARICSVFKLFARDPIFWKLFNSDINNENEVDNENPEENYYQAISNILKIYAEAKSLGLASDSTEITFEKAKELKGKIDPIKIRDTIKVWGEIQQQAAPSGRTYPDFTELSKKSCKEVVETFDIWIKENKDHIFITNLNLWCKSLIYLPEAICNLTRLEVLFLEDNKLHSLPDSIGDLNQLTILSLDGNPIRRLPSSIHRIKNHCSINTSNTLISHSCVIL